MLGAILVAPDSRDTTWDVLRGRFGPDVAYIDEALKKVFAQYNIETSRICLAGFSDGGTYAYSLGEADAFDVTNFCVFMVLGLSSERSPVCIIYLFSIQNSFLTDQSIFWPGITNGDLFTHIMAFSPGGLSPSRAVGKPKVFDSHGKNDEILPIDKTSRFIVPLLKRQGYDVTYIEFDGTHYIPDNIAEQAMEWFL